jgi:hypothetical protein
MVTFRVWLLTVVVVQGAGLQPLLLPLAEKLVRKLFPAEFQLVPSDEYDISMRNPAELVPFLYFSTS